MKAQDLLPNWKDLTKEEQERVKKTHPLFFATRKELQKKGFSSHKQLDITGADHISPQELKREYKVEEEDQSSQRSMLRTEGTGHE